jgi:hypothetical protein
MIFPSAIYSALLLLLLPALVSHFFAAPRFERKQEVAGARESGAKAVWYISVRFAMPNSISTIKFLVPFPRSLPQASTSENLIFLSVNVSLALSLWEQQRKKHFNTMEFSRRVLTFEVPRL